MAKSLEELKEEMRKLAPTAKVFDKNTRKLAKEKPAEPAAVPAAAPAADTAAGALAGGSTETVVLVGRTEEQQLSDLAKATRHLTPARRKRDADLEKGILDCWSGPGVYFNPQLATAGYIEATSKGQVRGLKKQMHRRYYPAESGFTGQLLFLVDQPREQMVTELGGDFRQGRPWLFHQPMQFVAAFLPPDIGVLTEADFFTGAHPTQFFWANTDKAKELAGVPVQEERFNLLLTITVFVRQDHRGRFVAARYHTGRHESDREKSRTFTRKDDILCALPLDEKATELFTQFTQLRMRSRTAGSYKSDQTLNVVKPREKFRMPLPNLVLSSQQAEREG